MTFGVSAMRASVRPLTSVPSTSPGRYFGAFVLDLDENNVEAVYHHPG